MVLQKWVYPESVFCRITCFGSSIDFPYKEMRRYHIRPPSVPIKNNLLYMNPVYFDHFFLHLSLSLDLFFLSESFLSWTLQHHNSEIDSYIRDIKHYESAVDAFIFEWVLPFHVLSGWYLLHDSIHIQTLIP